MQTLQHNKIPLRHLINTNNTQFLLHHRTNIVMRDMNSNLLDIDSLVPLLVLVHRSVREIGTDSLLVVVVPELLLVVHVHLLLFLRL